MRKRHSPPISSRWLAIGLAYVLLSEICAAMPLATTGDGHVRIPAPAGNRRTVPSASLAPSGPGCSPAWIGTFGGAPGVGRGSSEDGEIHDLVVYDDGTGPAVFAVGQFTTANGVPATYVAKWDGAHWHSILNYVSGAFSTTMMAAAVYDDGTGPALYVGGRFTVLTQDGIELHTIAKWDGENWSALDNDFFGPVASVHDLAVFDDGSGPMLYAAGSFVSQLGDGSTARGIARWNGSQWSVVGAGGASVNESHGLAVFDDGNGPALYMGGEIELIDGVEVSNIARWDGQTWSDVGLGVDDEVTALAAFDDGTGSALYVGGGFNFAGKEPARRIARWDGYVWSEVAGGAGSVETDRVHSLTVADLGAGPALYAGGTFLEAGGATVNHIARLDGDTWSPLGLGTDGIVRATTPFDDGSGPALIVGGLFEVANGDVGVDNIAGWDGAQWSRLGEGLDAAVQAITDFDDGSGSAVYVAGRFVDVGDIDANHIAKWNGISWEALGDGLNGPVHALAVFDDGGGPALYAAGNFTEADGAPADNLAKWDGTIWSEVGGGTNGPIYALQVYDDGEGPALYVGGFASKFGPLFTNHIAKWNGQSWSNLATGLIGAVRDMTVYDSGDGPELIAVGQFSHAGQVEMKHVARWNGEQWRPIAPNEGTNNWVFAVTVYDDGAGPGLFVGGRFTQPGRRIARWRDGAWSSLGQGVPHWEVKELTVFDDGFGQVLIAGGSFYEVDDKLPARRVARWNGTEWSALGDGVSDDVLALHAFDEGDRSSLIVGGSFVASPEGDSYLAKYQGCLPTTAPAPLVDFTIAFGSLLEGGLDELINSDDERLRARSGIGFSALEPTVLDLRVGAISINVDAASINATIEARINHPNGGATVRLRNWSTNQFETVHTYTIGTTESAELIDAIDAMNHIRATDGRIELSHKTVVAATFSALGFDGSFDRIAVEVVD